MKKIFVLFSILLLFLSSFAIAQQTIDKKSGNSSLTSNKRDQIQSLIQENQALRSVISQQQQTISQLKKQLLKYSQLLQQVNANNVSLESTDSQQKTTLAQLRHKIFHKPNRVADYQDHSLPTFTGILFNKTQALLNCTSQNCQWAPEDTYFPKDNLNYIVKDYNDQFHSRRFVEVIFIVVITFIILAVLLIIFMYGKFSQYQPGFKSKKYDKKLSEDEIASISGEDVYRSKLDLARAYIDMEDIVSAKKVLNDVIDNGSNEQKAEAQRLRQEINLSSH